MTTYGLTNAGYTAPRMSDYLLIIRTDYNARLVQIATAAGQPIPEAPDYTRDRFLGQITEIMAEQLAQLSQANQANYDARHLGNATGLQLDNLCLLVGVTRFDATKGTITIRCTGTDGTTILQGKVVEGGGETGTARWVCTEDGVIGQLVSGYVDLEFEAQEAGQIIAPALSIDTANDVGRIVTPVSGWTSASNPSAANPGRDRETDAALLARRQRAISALGSTSTAAILGALLQLDEVSSAVVIDNITNAVVVTDGLTLQPISVGAVVAPSTLTTSQQELVGQTIFGRLGAGTNTSGAVEVTITKTDGRAHPIRFTLASDAGVTIAYTVTLEPGYVLDDVTEPLEDLVADYFLTLFLGATIYPLALCALAATVDGIADVSSILINGSALPLAHLATEQPVLTSVTVS